MTQPEFFIPGRTYRHYHDDGTPGEEGLFLVSFVGRAPEPFEHHSETLGVAFGWRQGIGPNGEWEALGAYVTPDAAGWVEVRPFDSAAVEPDGCRWCGDAPGHHGGQFTPGIGLHQWTQPSDRQRLERMRHRRAARTEATRTPWAIAIEPDPIRPTACELIETPDLDRLTEALSDPNAEQALYRVTYQRVGRRGGRDGGTPPPPLTVWATGADDLAEQIHADIRRYLLSRETEVTVDLEQMRGQIWAGLNNGGACTIERLASANAARSAQTPQED